MQHLRKTSNRPEKPLAQTRQAASRVSDYGTRYGYYLFENAYGYAGVNKISIADAGLVCVLGQNLQTPEPSSSGAGKTRMWKLFLYLWFGKKALGSAESIKDAMIFGKNFRIECTVQRHGKWYLVREAHNHESYPEGLHAYEIVDKKLKPWGTVNDPNALRAKLQGLIGVSYNEMIGTTVWPQDFTHTLICGKPQERITFLSELYGFTKYDEVYKYLDTLHAQVKSKIEQLLEFKGEYRVIEQELSQVGDIKSVIDEARCVKAWIDSSTPKLSNMRRKLGDVNRRIDRYNEISSQLESFMKLELDSHERNLLVEGKLLSTFDTASKGVEQRLASLEAQADKADKLNDLKKQLSMLNIEAVDIDKLQREQQHLSVNVIPELAREARWSRDEIETLSSGAAAMKNQVIQLCRELKIKPDLAAIKKVYADGFARLQNWLEPLAIGQKTVIVGDAHTLPLYGSRVKAVLEAMGVQASLVMLPAGEAHKTIDAVRQLWNAFLQAGIERKNVVFALGGGVVGDLTGFAAATWLRGIRWVNLPTTLLSMVDAGIGGKTGADLPEGKNLIGAFHPPALVVSDTSTLTSLPLHEWRNGLAEAIKHAIIGDPALLTYMPAFSAFLKQGESLALTPRACAAFVAQAMAVKVRIIQQDPFEKGIRAALNLGHTIGHAIEQVTHFGVSHGEAVAIGTVQEARLAEEIGSAEAGLAARIEALFSSVGLPTALPIGLSVPALKEAMSVDKKKADGLVRFALPVAVGEVRINQVISDHMLGVLVHVQQREA
jgi:3-dehydroquinate synthase